MSSLRGSKAREAIFFSKEIPKPPALTCNEKRGLRDNIGKKSKRALILCMGNYLLGDDGVGVHIAKKLTKEKLPKNVELLEAGASLFYLFPFLEDATHMIFVDALKKGGKRGKVYTLGSEEILAMRLKSPTVHELGLVDALDILKFKKQKLPEMVLIGVEPENVSIGIELSSRVEMALSKVIQRIKKTLKKWGYISD